MALQRKYGARFERLWAAYPKWPAGRSKKEMAWKAYQAADRALGFTDDDIAFIERDIEQRKAQCVTWQRGNKFGPVGLQVYFNQHLWNEPYEKLKNRFQATNEVPQTVWQRMGYADEEAYKRGEKMERVH